MFRLVSYWMNYFRYANSRHPSWRVWYKDTRTTSIPLQKEDARTRCKLFGGHHIAYTRDYKGDLIKGPITWPKKLGLSARKTHQKRVLRRLREKWRIYLLYRD